MKTYQAKPAEVKHAWYVVDAEGKTLGRLATRIARVLSGKHKPIYTPHVDTGDFVIVINADQVALTGKKLDQKKYKWYTGYTRLRSETAGKRLQRKPERIIRDAVRRMLPKNKLAFKLINKLKVYAGAEHPHQGQQPEVKDFA